MSITIDTKCSNIWYSIKYFVSIQKICECCTETITIKYAVCKPQIQGLELFEFIGSGSFTGSPKIK